MDQEILAEYERREINEYKIGKLLYKLISPERITWNIEALRSFVHKKLGPKRAVKAVTTRTVIELDVNEEYIQDLIKKKKLKNKDLSKFIDVQKIKPYIRSFDAKEQKDE